MYVVVAVLFVTELWAAANALKTLPFLTEQTPAARLEKKNERRMKLAKRLVWWTFLSRVTVYVHTVIVSVTVTCHSICACSHCQRDCHVTQYMWILSLILRLSRIPVYVIIVTDSTTATCPNICAYCHWQYDRHVSHYMCMLSLIIRLSRVTLYVHTVTNNKTVTCPSICAYCH